MVSISIRCVVKANHFCVDSGIKRNCEYNNVAMCCYVFAKVFCVIVGVLLCGCCLVQIKGALQSTM